MKLKITQPYLVFPVSNYADKRHVYFRSDEHLFLDLIMNLDQIHPSFFAYVDIRPLLGKELDLSCSPAMEFSVRQAEDIDLPGLYREPLRPRIHFTAKSGWTNDPNGLFYSNGTYHLFYQYNPCATTWNNMHWGHAVSQDLIHWQELPVVLRPDALGLAYSGSAVVDRENRSGLGEGTHPPILLFYTAAGNPYTQCIAYSTDDGSSFRLYKNNPVISNIAQGNRDPKVVWVPELSCYLMALYLEQDRYQLLRSADLLHWSRLQELSLPGEEECPDLIPLSALGGHSLWAFLGASETYLIGQFQEGLFVPLQEPRKLSYGKRYAAQSFSNLPKDRIIRLAWNTLYITDSRISQQISFPTEVSFLQKDGLYLLQEYPIEEIRSLYVSADTLSQTLLLPEKPLEIPLSAVPHDLELTILQMSEGSLQLQIFGLEILVDFAKKELCLGEILCPLPCDSPTLTLRVLLDTCSVEVFLNHGTTLCTARHYCDYNLSRLTLRTEHPVIITKITWHALRSIWD